MTEEDTEALFKEVLSRKCSFRVRFDDDPWKEKRFAGVP
jgi:hypothetical protein